MLTMAEAKKSGIKAAGEEFECVKSDFYGGGPTGSIGTILPELSARGKLQASLTCSVEGCTETHIREVSDWHQSSKCATHSTAKSKGSGKSAGTGGGRSVKVTLDDGTVETFREMKVSPTDDAETVALKEENNKLFEAYYAAEQAKREEEKVKAQAERKAKQEAERAEREAAKAVEKKAAIQAQLERAKQLAAQKGVTVSPKLIAAAQE